MSDDPRFKWEEPPKFTCDGCGTVAQGALSNGGRFSDTGPTMPPGWIRGYDRIAKEVKYACSGACGNVVMMGPRGGGA